MIAFSLNVNAQIDRSVQPKQGETPKINLKKPQTFKLSNGLNVIVVENKKLPTFSLRISIDNPPTIIYPNCKKKLHHLSNDLNEIEYNGFIVIRSTIPPGTADNLNCYFMPEFLTEKNFINDFINNKEWVFGILGSERDGEFKSKISTLFDLAFENSRIEHNNLTFLLNKEAEMVKMFRNCFLATKVGFCNEMYQFCSKKNVNYENVRKLACNDDRIVHSHTKVPGHDGKLGYGGTCFPKDTNALSAFARGEFSVLDEVISANNRYRQEYELDDREKEQKVNYG